MTKDLYLSLLRQGNTGDEILSILETIVAGDDNVPAAENGPTMNTIDF